MSGQVKSSHKHAGDGRHSTNSLHPDSPPRSFLFVINKLEVKNDDNHSAGDGWYNRVPPINPTGFAGETRGQVMRYRNGRVAAAPGYGWYREDRDLDGTAWPPGYVLMYHPDGSHVFNEDGTLRYAIVYKQLAVFSCNPFLPIVVDNGDPLSADSLVRTPLLFHHPSTQQGISHAVHPESLMQHGPGPCKFVAGANPSWVPSLVPATYSNPYNPSDPSRGLAGELPIILGLMAFSEPTELEGAVDQIFLGSGGHRGKWRDGRWHRTEAPQGYALSALENPRGFLVTVLFDPENPDSSNVSSLQALEWKEVIVREN
ncbi:hypothetical protein GGI35DRAFT_164619 [Trichoderma velutinum]